MQIGHEFRANDEDFVEGQFDRLLHVAVDPQREVASRRHAALQVRVEPEARQRTDTRALARW
jgi:hypothetical protein